MIAADLDQRNAVRYADKAVCNADDDADLVIVRDNAYREYLSTLNAERVKKVKVVYA